MEEPVLFETEEDLPDDGETEDNDAIDIDIEPDPAPAVGGDGVPMIVEEGGMDPTANLESDGLEHLYNPRLDLSNYKFPPVQLLADYSDMWFEISMDEMERNKERIVRTLASYKIKVEKISAKKGPTVTLYRIHLAEGIRIAKVKVLEEDIAMSMGAKGVRVITLPDSIGIEVANEKASVVPLKMVLNSPQFLEKSAKMELPVAMGITVTNEPFFFDLAKMPHLLVAGATGMGKSVGLNAIVTSLLYTKHPAEMKFVMVDPKQVELDFYRKLEKHYLATLPDAEEAIITDTTKVIHTLKSLCVEMESRYTLLREAGVRKITEYNQKFLARRLNPVNGHKFLPYIVVILDEFADLICTAGREIEEPIARLAQKARAVGIHLVIATQRPTTDVITGTI
ncbi:MAG: DNA translocase FtsK, partial [Bacteroidales bacterium]|nr:DNA translocase FtsK [Bacteroidales bacterium]